MRIVLFILSFLLITSGSLYAGQNKKIAFGLKRLKFYDDRGGDFTLNSSGQQSVSLHDFKGKVVLLNFGYTSCPDVCPLVLSQLKMAMNKLGKRNDQVQTLFITIDPERDTPERLGEYVAFFDPSFIGLSGTVAEVKEVASKYRARYFKKIKPGHDQYFMAHTDAVYLIDQEGRYRGRYKTEWTLEEMIEDIQILLTKPN